VGPSSVSDLTCTCGLRTRCRRIAPSRIPARRFRPASAVEERRVCPSKSAAPSWSSAESDRAAAQAPGTSSASPRRTPSRVRPTCAGSREARGDASVGPTPALPAPSPDRPSSRSAPPAPSRTPTGGNSRCEFGAGSLGPKQGFLGSFYSAGAVSSSLPRCRAYLTKADPVAENYPEPSTREGGLW
jgi:hypothetical protein